MQDEIRKQFLAALLEKKMDPVGHEDGDVDNDGDEDESDQYILNRRKAIKKAIQKEEAELEESDSYYAMQKAKEHAKRDGKNYDGDVSVQHKYDAYHMKKRGYTHFSTGRFGTRTYHKGAAAGATKIDSSHYSGVRESVEIVEEVGTATYHKRKKEYHARMTNTYSDAANRHYDNDDHKRAERAERKMQAHDEAADAHHFAHEEIKKHGKEADKDIINHAHQMSQKLKESIDEGLLGAIGGALAGGALGTKYGYKAGSLAAKGAAKLGKDLATQTAAQMAASKYAPAAAAAVGGVAGDRLTRRKNRREDVDYDDFAPLTEAEELFIEENQELVFEAVSELLYEENIDWQELTEEELNELIGRMARAINNRIGITRAGRTERDKRKAQKDLDKAVAIRQRTQAKQDRRDAKRELRRAKSDAKDNSPRAILKKRSAELKQRQKDSRQKEADAMSKARETRMAQFRSSRS